VSNGITIGASTLTFPTAGTYVITATVTNHTDSGREGFNMIRTTGGSTTSFIVGMWNGRSNSVGELETSTMTAVVTLVANDTIDIRAISDQTHTYNINSIQIFAHKI
jgi:hypothetical protein